MSTIQGDTDDVFDDICSRYTAGENVSRLTAEMGCTVWDLYKRFHQGGIALRGQPKRRPGRRRALPVLAIVSAYELGCSIKSLAERYSASRGVITARIKEAGARLRTQSEQSILDARRQTPAARAARVAAAHAARRGMTPSDDTLHRAALARQSIGAQTPREMGWATLFRQAGIETVPQFAFGRYNIDLAVPQAKVAIEIQCGWHYHKGSRHAVRDAKKAAALKDAGWLLFALQDKQMGGRAHHDAVFAIRQRLAHAQSASSPEPPNVLSPMSRDITQ